MCAGLVELGATALVCGLELRIAAPPRRSTEAQAGKQF